MAEQESGVVMEPTGLNPHFKPRIIAPEGMEVGIIYDADGMLSISCRIKGGEWKSGYEPLNAGPAVGHEFQPDEFGRCVVCEQD